YSFQVVGPTGIQVLRGNEAILECIITEFSGATGKWSKLNEADEIFGLYEDVSPYNGSGYNLTKHSDWSVDTTGTRHYDLKIPNVDINDEGCYFCGIAAAKNNAMSQVCGNLIVFVPLSNPPSLTSYSHADTAVVTRNVMATFICTTSGTKPAATIEWYIDTTQITIGITTDTTSNGLYDTTSTLQYIPVWNSDQDKDIKCEAHVFNTNAQYSTYVTLDVLVPPSLPVIDGYNNNADFTVNAGTSSTLTCTATAKPAPTIEWYIDNTLLLTTLTSQTSNAEDIELFDVSSTLIFIPQWSNHLQYVKCKAENNAIGNAAVTRFQRLKMEYNVGLIGTVPSDLDNRSRRSGNSTKDSTRRFNNSGNQTFTGQLGATSVRRQTGSSRTLGAVVGRLERLAVNTIIISDDANAGGYISGDDVTVTDGLSHILTCKTIGSKPEASNIHWDTDEFTLLWSYHSKTITCEGSNSAPIQPATTNIKRDVQVYPDSVTISEESSGVVIVTSGHMTTLTCIAMGARPACDIQWSVDNDNLDDDETISDNTQDSDLKDTTSTMTFTPTYQDHQNTTLTCKATNYATIAKGQPVMKELTLDVWVGVTSSKAEFNLFSKPPDQTLYTDEFLPYLIKKVDFIHVPVSGLARDVHTAK
ncbi:uncharacterized protein LOC144355726, partial [Saccoglossus kowalevskii]